MNNQPKKYAIYTAMVGGYDEIMQPVVVDDRFDYILFSNDIKEDRVGVWQVRPIAYTNPDNTRICRYVKTHPEELLPDYEFSIWMDSNIQIITPFVYERSIDLYLSRVLVSTIFHVDRQCIYDEAFEVLLFRVESEKIILNWCHRLVREKYPKNNGLGETGLMFRIHSISEVHMFDELWWKCIDKYSKRDQLSFDYVMWKLGMNYEYFFPKLMTVLNSPYVRYHHHANESKKFLLNTILEPWLVRYYRKVPTSYEEIKKVYYCIYQMPFSSMWSHLLGQIYRAKYFVKRQQKNIIRFLR